MCVYMVLSPLGTGGYWRRERKAPVVELETEGISVLACPILSFDTFDTVDTTTSN